MYAHFLMLLFVAFAIQGTIGNRNSICSGEWVSKVWTAFVNWKDLDFDIFALFIYFVYRRQVI